MIFFLDMGSTPFVKVTLVNTSQTIMPASINSPDITHDNKIKIASPLDLMTGKLFALQDRSEHKDFIDLGILLENGVSLQKGFEAAYSIAKAAPKGLVSQLTLLKGIQDRLSSQAHIEQMIGNYSDSDARVKLIVLAANKINLDKVEKSRLQINKDLCKVSVLER